MKKEHSYRTSIEIAAPPGHVWAIMADIENWPRWTPTVRKVRRLDGKPLAIGSRVIIHQPRLPPALWRVVALDPGRSFTSVSSGLGISVFAYHEIEPAGEGSVVSLSVAFDGFLAALVSKLTAGLNERYLGLEAAGLKKKSEDTYVTA